MQPRPRQSSVRLATAIAALVLAPMLSGCIGGLDDTVQAADVNAEGELKEFHLYVHNGVAMEPLPGKRMGFFGFSFSPDGGATVPGPEIRVREGDRVRVTLHQPDGLPHTLHWHGLSVPWEMDGVPFMTQDLAFEKSTYVYEFTAFETGTYWYHCHVDAPIHVDFGLFGAIIVEPRDPAQDPPFDREETLIIHELASTDPSNEAFFSGREPHDQRTPGGVEDYPDWAQRYPRGFLQAYGAIAGGVTGMPPPFLVPPRDYYPDYSLRYHPYYDTFMINGKSFPETEPVHVETGETVRLRVVHAGQLIHTLHLHGHHFLVTHKDGFNLPAPYHADSLVIGPGERYDLYVKANNPGIWDFHDHGGSWELGSYAANDHAFPGGMSTMLVYDDFEHPALPKPKPGEALTSGDYALFAKNHRERVAGGGAHAGHGAHGAHAERIPSGPTSTTSSGGATSPLAGSGLG